MLTLAQAREQAQAYNEMLLAKGDPIKHRTAQRPVAQHTFREVAKMFYDAHKEEWHNLRYRRNWWSQFETHILGPDPTARDKAAPSGIAFLGKRPIDQIATGDVLKVLTPIWTEMMKTADDLRRRGASVWDYAKALKWAVGKSVRLGQQPEAAAGRRVHAGGRAFRRACLGTGAELHG